MRKLPFLLVLLLLSLMLLAAAASAHALTLPSVPPVGVLAGSADNEEAEEDEQGEADEQGEENEADEGEEAESDEGEDCSVGDEAEEELCEEKAEEEAEAEECLLEDAEASVVVSPGAGAARLTIRYDAFEPTAVAIDAGLHGGKGNLRLGSERARFRRSGTFHDSFGLGGKQLTKALAARGFEVDVHAVGTPADCALHLANRVPHRAK